MPALNAFQACGVIRELQQETDLTGLVRDRASGHTHKTVLHLGMPLVPLPPDSPEMNSAERIFQELRCQVEGTIYASLDDKADAVTQQSRRLDANRNLVRSLADWD